MLTLRPTMKFRKDYKRAQKRGWNMDLLEEVIDVLLAEKPLDPRYHDHPLIGDYAGFRECHVLPDWLLIYKAESDTCILVAAATGTHADLF